MDGSESGQDGKIDILILTGGIGGTRLVEGFYHLKSISAVPVVNTGDDIYMYGLRICPDIDILIYTLANAVDRHKGWGLKGDTFRCLHKLELYYGRKGWFHLGDGDLALHIFRTHMLRYGFSLSEITEEVARIFGLRLAPIPMTESYYPTYILPSVGPTGRSKYRPFMHNGSELPIPPINAVHFQEYLVKMGAKPHVDDIIYGMGNVPTVSSRIRGLMERADKIVIAPSNPFMSIGPFLSIPFYRDMLTRLRRKVIAVTPIISGKAVKGPLIMNMRDFGFPQDCTGVAEIYREFIGTFIVDIRDKSLRTPSGMPVSSVISSFDIEPVFYDTLMTDIEKKIALAQFITDL